MTTSNTSHEFAAEVLASSVEGLAASAATRLLGRYPWVTARYQPHPYLAWRRTLESRYSYLVAALRTGRTSLLKDQVAWLKISLAARDIPPSEIEATLVCMLECARDELPPSAADPIVQYLRDALDHLAQSPAKEPAFLLPTDPFGRLGLGYLVNLLEGNRQQAASLILDAANGLWPRLCDAPPGFPPLSHRDAYLRVLRPVQREGFEAMLSGNSGKVILNWEG